MDTITRFVIRVTSPNSGVRGYLDTLHGTMYDTLKHATLYATESDAEKYIKENAVRWWINPQVEEITLQVVKQ